MLEEPTSGALPPSKKARVSGAEADAPPVQRKNSNGADVVLPMRPTEAMPKLMAAGVLGMQGFCLLDLHKQEYQQPPKNPKPGEADVSASSSVDPPLTKRFSAVYPSVKHAMGVDWSALAPRIPPFYCALQLLCDLQAATRPPTPSPCLPGARRDQPRPAPGRSTWTGPPARPPARPRRSWPGSSSGGSRSWARRSGLRRG